MTDVYFAVINANTVYGVGRSEVAALIDAARWLSEANIKHDDDSNQVVSITKEHYDSIVRGDVRAVYYGPKTPKPRRP
jgi:hypothetical protein